MKFHMLCFLYKNHYNKIIKKYNYPLKLYTPEECNPTLYLPLYCLLPKLKLSISSENLLLYWSTRSQTRRECIVRSTIPFERYVER